jgi:hypothetical protein
VPSTLAAFFDRYRRAFAKGDVDALLGLLDVPLLVVGRGGPSAVTVPDALRTRLHAQVDRHADAGVSDATFDLLGHRRLAASLVQAEVRWQFRDDGGEDLAVFDLMYLLHATEHGWRICVVAPLEAIG